MNIIEVVEIDHTIDRVYTTFADLPRWCEILPDVLGIEILYFDGYNQEFTMTVERPAGPETVRGIRYCRPPHELEIFQPVPPPGLQSMSGRWVFAEGPHGTTVTATRKFQLKPGDPRSEEAEQQFGQRLQLLLRNNLLLFKKAIEHDGSH